ncbi:hypothetical protein RQP46_007028 [Phenoliferia psychrophenolica]
MATRRATRQTAPTRGGANGNENDLAAKGHSILVQGKPQPLKQAQPAQLRAVKALGAKSTNSSVASTSTVAATRKRGALAEVTNGASKAKASTSASSHPKPVSKAGSSTTATRRYGTRSSTGGSVAADEEPEPEEEDDYDEQEREEQQDEEEDQDDDMVLDDNPVPEPAVRHRAIKAVPSRAASTKAASASNVPTTRLPLGSKRVNTGAASTSTIAVATKKGAASTSARAGGLNNKPAAARAGSLAHAHAPQANSVQARRSLKEKAEVLRKAQEDFEEAERTVQQHKAKKAKTSEPDYAFHDDDPDAKDAGWEDLDEGDEDDPLMVSSYVVEVYEYLRVLELKTMPSPDYMLTHTEVTWKMRGILIDWLIEIHTKFRLLPETIFLATNIIDRLLSLQEVSLVKFQLVGITALFIAAKYEEVVCPSVANFLFMTDGGYEDDEILRAERHVLAQLDFNLSYPNPINFLRRISKADGYDIQSRTMAKYLMEISIVDHKFLPAPPSLIAAAGSWLARKILGKGAWDANLVHYSGYSEEELKPTAQLMLDFVVRNSALAQPDKRADNPLHPNQTPMEDPLPNFVKKYSGKKFFKAFTAVKRWAETEYQPIDFMNPKTRKTERREVPAIL